MHKVIVIPARYASTRLPGKPLTMIAGKPLLARVAEVARAAAAGRARVLVATDHPAIEELARSLGLDVAMTDPDCPSGTDRAWAAVKTLDPVPDVVVNLQGDNPTCPPAFVAALLDAFDRDPEARVATPCVRLSWAELDALREHKKTAPGSGTFVQFVRDGGENGLARGWALTFSKREIPGMRRERALREAGGLSPVYRHVGLYGYRREALAAFVGWGVSWYEGLEGLEQMRFVERGVRVRVVEVEAGEGVFLGGVDAPEDAARAAAYFEAKESGNGV